MRSIPKNFTFSDNSTLTSCTDLRLHTVVTTKKHANGDGDDNGNLASVSISMSGNINSNNAIMVDENDDDCRFFDHQDEDNKDKENSQRREESSIAISSSNHSTSSNIHSKNNETASSIFSGLNKFHDDDDASSSSSQDSNQFWAALSVHAASAAMSSSYNNKMKESAANAASKSLLEDGQAMERINASRHAQLHMIHHKKKKKKKTQSCHFVVTDTNSSIRVVRPPMKITHQTVRNAASKASIAVLQSSGGNQEVAAAVASAILKEGGSMLNQQTTKSRNGSLMASSSSKKKMSLTNPSSKGSSSSSSSSRRSRGSASTEKTTNTNNATLADGSRSSSSSLQNSKLWGDDDNNNEQQQEQQQQLLLADDDQTVRSISTAKFGKDKYASMASSPRVLTELKIASAAPTEDWNAARTMAAATMENDDRRNNDDASRRRTCPPLSSDSVSVMTRQSTARGPEEDGTVSSTKDGPSFQAQGRMMEVLSSSKSTMILQESETRDDSTISTATYHKLSRHPSPLTTYGGDKSYLDSSSSSVGGKSASSHHGVQQVDTSSISHSVQQVMGASCSSHSVVHQLPQDDESYISGLDTLLTSDERHLEEEELEQKHANFLAAMETLQQKLDELDSEKKSCASASASHSRDGHGEAVQRQGQQHPHQEQLHQLSMIANPTGLLSTDKSSSSCTYYPPFPAMDTIMTVETNFHHGYANGANSNGEERIHPPSVTSASSESSVYGRYSVPIGSDAGSVNSNDAVSHASISTDNSAVLATAQSNNNNAAVQPSSASSVRSVLKKPTQCFPIVEAEDEYFDFDDIIMNGKEDHLTWDDDGTIFLSVGECRTDINSTPSILTTNISNEEGGEVVLMEEAIEVVLVTTPNDNNPMSPTNRLKHRFKDFFLRRNKSKKVTFDITNIDDESSDELLSPTLHCAATADDVAKNTNSLLVKQPIDSTATTPTSRPSPKIGRSAARSAMRGRRLRDTLLKKLRRTVTFSKSTKGSSSFMRSSKREDSSETKNNTAVSDPTYNTAVSDPTSPSTLTLSGEGILCAVDNQQCEDVVDAMLCCQDYDRMNPASLPPPPQPEAATARITGSSVHQRFSDAVNSPSSANDESVASSNDTEYSVSSEISHASSKSTITTHKGNEYDTSNNSVVDSHSIYSDVNDCFDDIREEEATSVANNTYSGSSRQDGSDTSYSAGSSMYINDVIAVTSLSTYNSIEISDEVSWVETVLSRFTNGELITKGLFMNNLTVVKESDGGQEQVRGEGKGGDANASTGGGSSKKSLAGYNFV